MMETVTPHITTLNAAFWEAGADGRLKLPWCPQSRRHFWPPSPISPFADVVPEWREAGCEGIIESLVVYHRAFQAPLAEQTPYGIALIALDAGPRLQVHVRRPASHAVGERARLTFAALVAGGQPVPVMEAIGHND